MSSKATETSATSTLSLHDALPICFIINGSDFSTTTQSPDTALQVCVVQLDPTTLNETGVRSEEHTSELQSPRALVSTPPPEDTIVAPTVPFMAGDTCQSTAAFHPV